MTVIHKLGLGVNLLGYTGDIDMAPGEALMARDVLPRVKGDIMTHWGYVRHGDTGLGGHVIWHKGFSYKGKNSGAADIRTGNFGADTGAIFTRRVDWLAAQLVFTQIGVVSTVWRWDHVTEAYIVVAMPAGITVLNDPHPSGFVAQNNLYIAGWARNANLRYDPTDELLYVIGWPDEPTLAGIAGPNAAASTLTVDATYLYRAAWIDLYTGEQSGLGPEYEFIPTAALPTLDLQSPPNYGAGANERHFYDAANPEESDVGIIIYRTEADGGQFNFLGMVYPSVPAGYNELANADEWTDTTALVDNGLATDASRPASTRTYFDPPLMDAWVYHKRMWWGLAWGDEARSVSEWAEGKVTDDVRNANRVFHNDFSGLKSQLERWKSKDYQEISTGEGDVLTCVAASDRQLTVFSTETAYEMVVRPNFSTGSIEAPPKPLGYGVGCVGPRAWTYQGGYIHWLSRTGPYRARPGQPEEWIGKLLAPMFIDPESGMCKLNPTSMLRAQVCYDQDAKMIRYIMPVGVSYRMNRHIGWWTLGPEENGDPFHGWFFFSTRVQWMDFTHAMGGIDPDTDAPFTQFVKAPRLVWGEAVGQGATGYVCQYEVGSRRAGLENGLIASGAIRAAGSSTVNIATDAGFPTDGDGLDGLRLEVVHADGTINITTVASNTDNDLVPTDELSQNPSGGTFYVAGIPAYWLGWVDHNGDPHAHKDLTHLYLSFNRQTTDPNTVTDVTVAAADDFPGTFDVRATVNADRNTQAVLVASVGRFWQYEFSNTRPDERFCLTSIDREFKPLARRQR